MTTTKKTCAVCFRSFKLHATGRLARHGFKVQDRKKGQYGCAWQTGSCAGANFPHYGLSAQGTEWALTHVSAHLGELDERAGELATRPPLKYVSGRGRDAITILPGAGPSYDRDVGHPGYDFVHRVQAKRVQAEIEKAIADIEFYKQAIADWAPTE